MHTLHSSPYKSQRDSTRIARWSVPNTISSALSRYAKSESQYFSAVLLSFPYLNSRIGLRTQGVTRCAEAAETYLEVRKDQWTCRIIARLQCARSKPIYHGSILIVAMHTRHQVRTMRTSKSSQRHEGHYERVGRLIDPGASETTSSSGRHTKPPLSTQSRD